METGKKWLRIAELEKQSGVSRRTIHFYLQEKLLHSPARTGKTMAYYDESHLRRLAFINEAKQKGLPLIAIRKEIENLVKQDRSFFGDSLLSDRHLKKKLNESSEGKEKPIPKREQGKRTREAILGVGCDLFRDKGYKATKVSDITKILGIGKGTFYFYFTNKQELLLECVPRLFGELFSDQWEAIRKTRDPQKRLAQRAFAVMPVLREFCAIIQLSKEAMEDDDPKLKELGRQTYLSIRHPLEIDIKKGIQLEQFQPVDPKITATMMIGLVENLYYMQSFEKLLTSDDAWRKVFDLIIYGIQRETKKTFD